MAIAGGVGSSVSDTVNNGFQILDISPAKVQVINGVWLADGQPVWVEFSPTDEHVITTGMIFGLGTSVTVFDAMSRTRLFEVEDRSCDIGFFDPIQTGFSKDNQYIYRTVQCDTSSQNPSTIISITKFTEF